MPINNIQQVYTEVEKMLCRKFDILCRKKTCDTCTTSQNIKKGISYTVVGFLGILKFQ